MARFNGPSPAASAHAAMMRSKKGGGGGCAVMPFAILLIGMPIALRFIA